MGRKGVTRKRNKPPVTYADVDREEVSVGNPLDIAVHRRVERGRLYRRLVRASQAVVDALGKKSRVWFDYERVLSRLTDLRQAAYFDLGVEHGVAAARAQQLKAGRSVEKLAAQLVREVLVSDLPREQRAAAAVLAAWAMIGSQSAKSK